MDKGKIEREEGETLLAALAVVLIIFCSGVMTGWLLFG